MLATRRLVKPFIFLEGILQIFCIDVYPITHTASRQGKRKGLGHSWRILANIHVASNDHIKSKRSIIILYLNPLKQRRSYWSTSLLIVSQLRFFSFLLGPQACISRILPLLHFLFFRLSQSHTRRPLTDSLDIHAIASVSCMVTVRQLFGDHSGT